MKDWLLTAGFDEAEIAIKTAEQNDLNQPENQNLLSPTNRVRAIITKQALQEGWDCPFAYVLCALAASSNLRAMTQLIGRILRQPDAMKTGVGIVAAHWLEERPMIFKADVQQAWSETEEPSMRPRKWEAAFFRSQSE